MSYGQKIAGAQACANLQHADLRLLAAEPCGCTPEQVRRCGEEKRFVDYLESTRKHNGQVVQMHEAATDVLERLDRRCQSPTAWQQPAGKSEIVTEQKSYPYRGLRNGWPLWEITTGMDEDEDGKLTRRISLKRLGWRRWDFRTPNTDLLPDHEISSAFATMLYCADDLDAAYSRRRTIPYCNAPTSSARAFQAAAAVLTAYYDDERIGPAEYDAAGVWQRHDFPAADVSAARIVAQVFDRCLQPREIRPHPKAAEVGEHDVVADYFVLIYSLDRSEVSRSSRDVGELLGRDASTIRARLDRSLDLIEGQLGKYCNGYNDLALYPQSASRSVYNIDSQPVPIASRLITPKVLDRPALAPSSKTDAAVFKLLCWAVNHSINQISHLGYGKPEKRPAGLASNYEGTTLLGERQYPIHPYGSDPILIFTPMLAFDFGSDPKTSLPPALGLPFSNNFERWSQSWMNRGLPRKHRKSDDSDDDDVSSPGDLDATMNAHTERDDRIDRDDNVHEEHRFESLHRPGDDPDVDPRFFND